MDNGNKIVPSEAESSKSKEKQEIALFLGDDSKQLRAGGGPGYDLITEFQKTKNNRRPVVTVALIGIMAIVGIASWVITTLIDRNSRTVTVDISRFEDLNLRDLLDSAKRFNDELDRAIRDLKILEADMNTELEGIESRKRSSLTVIGALGLAPAELNRRKKALEQDTEKEIGALRARFDPQIKEKQALIASLQEKLSSYDTRSMKEAQKQQKLLDNQQQLYELERQRLTKFYEDRISTLDAAIQQEKTQSRVRLETTIKELTAKHTKEMDDLTALYNPAWSAEDAVSAILGKAREKPSNPFVAVSRNLPAGAIPDRASIDGTIQAYADMQLVLSRLKAVPYLNSVPGALAFLEAAGGVLGQDYVRLLSSSAEAVTTKNSQINRLENNVSSLDSRLEVIASAFTAYSRSVNAAGIVLDERNPSKILLYIDPLYGENATANRTAWLFRGDDALVAELLLLREGATVYGRTIRLEEGLTVKPFDKLVLKLTNPPEATP